MKRWFRIPGSLLRWLTRRSATMDPRHTLSLRTAACIALSAALQRLDDPYTLETLRLVPARAWDCCPTIRRAAKAIMQALKKGNAHTLPLSIHEDFDLPAEPRRLFEYCEDMIVRWEELAR